MFAREIPGHLTHKQLREGLFRLSKIQPSIVMVGDSLTAEPDWRELTGCPTIVNRGVGGDTSGDVLRRIDNIISEKPRAVFVMVGTNDAAQDIDPAVTAKNVRSIIDRLEAANIQAVFQYPLPSRKSGRAGKTNENISAATTALDSVVSSHKKILAIDLRPRFTDDGGFLRIDLSYNTLHLNPGGYKIWAAEIAPLVAKYCGPSAKPHSPQAH